MQRGNAIACRGTLSHELDNCWFFIAFVFCDCIWSHNLFIGQCTNFNSLAVLPFVSLSQIHTDERFVKYYVTVVIITRLQCNLAIHCKFTNFVRLTSGHTDWESSLHFCHHVRHTEKIMITPVIWKSSKIHSAIWNVFSKYCQNIVKIVWIRSKSGEPLRESV